MIELAKNYLKIQKNITYTYIDFRIILETFERQANNQSKGINKILKELTQCLIFLSVNPSPSKI